MFDWWTNRGPSIMECQLYQSILLEDIFQHCTGRYNQAKGWLDMIQWCLNILLRIYSNCVNANRAGFLYNLLQGTTLSAKQGVEFEVLWTFHVCFKVKRSAYHTHIWLYIYMFLLNALKCLKGSFYAWSSPWSHGCPQHVNFNQRPNSTRGSPPSLHSCSFLHPEFRFSHPGVRLILNIIMMSQVLISIIMYCWIIKRHQLIWPLPDINHERPLCQPRSIFMSSKISLSMINDYLSSSM